MSLTPLLHRIMKIINGCLFPMLTSRKYHNNRTHAADVFHPSPFALLFFRLVNPLQSYLLLRFNEQRTVRSIDSKQSPDTVNSSY